MAEELPTREERADDPLDQVILALDKEQTRQLLEIMDTPPPANDALKSLMRRTPPWGERSQTGEVVD